MQPEETRHASGLGVETRLDGGASDFACVGDQRRQQCGGAELGMRRTDLPDTLDGRFFVQKRTTAAVDLQVDEARHEQHAMRIDFFGIGGDVRHCHDRLDAAGLDHESTAVMPFDAVEQAGAGDCFPLAHLVSVTFLRLAGASGLRPRERDQASTKP
ncbi:hypothetical protein D9M68_466620 [compost metagenome]